MTSQEQELSSIIPNLRNLPLNRGASRIAGISTRRERLRREQPPIHHGYASASSHSGHRDLVAPGSQALQEDRP